MSKMYRLVSYVFNNHFIKTKILLIQCMNSWIKENWICECCDKYGKYNERTITHKFQRSYYYFWGLNCKNLFLDQDPDLSYEGYHRHSIPSVLRRLVFNRDRGQCVKCGSNVNIHFDHIIPFLKRRIDDGRKFRVTLSRF